MGKKNLTVAAQKFTTFWAILKNTSSEVKTAVATFWATF